VEFSLVAVLLLMLVLGILQIAVYLHVRNVAAASAAEGARYAANADVTEAAGADRAHMILASGVGQATAAHLSCSGALDEGPDGIVVSSVRCTGAIPVFFVPLGELLAIDVSGHSVEEGAVGGPPGGTAP
jgi:Flp pilus assembly protein TadG